MDCLQTQTAWRLDRAEHLGGGVSHRPHISVTYGIPMNLPSRISSLLLCQTSSQTRSTENSS